MAFGIYDWIYGIAQFAAAFLAIVAGIIALSMLKVSHQKRILRGWKWAVVALFFFMLVEVFGALKTFGIWSTPYLTHVLAGVVLLFLIAALVVQGHIKEGCDR